MNKHSTKLSNGVVKIYVIWGDGGGGYRTVFGFRKALARREHFGRRTMFTTEHWHCDKCDMNWKSEGWAKRHTCKGG